MWYLVYFPKSEKCRESFAVVSNRNLDKDNPGLEEIVGVIYPDKTYLGKILRKSAKKGPLELLNVSPEGNVSMKPGSACLGKPATKISIKANIKTAKKRAREDTTNAKNSNLLDDSEAGCSGLVSRGSRKKKAFLSKAIVDDYSTDSDKENEISIGVKVNSRKYQNKNNTLHDGTENIEIVEEQNEKLENFESVGNLQDSRQVMDIIDSSCSICKDLPVSPEFIAVVEQILSLMVRINGIRNKKKETGTILRKIPSWRLANSSKVELIPCSGVWIDSVDLGLHERQTEFIDDSLRVIKANKMIRLLFKTLIGEEDLLKCTAKGRGKKPAIDEVVYKTVELYIQNKFFKGKVYKNFTNVVNNMITTMRSELKNSKFEKNTERETSVECETVQDANDEKEKNSFLDGPNSSTFQLNGGDLNEKDSPLHNTEKSSAGRIVQSNDISDDEIPLAKQNNPNFQNERSSLRSEENETFVEYHSQVLDDIRPVGNTMNEKNHRDSDSRLASPILLPPKVTPSSNEHLSVPIQPVQSLLSDSSKGQIQNLPPSYPSSEQTQPPILHSRTLEGKSRNSQHLINYFHEASTFYPPHPTPPPAPRSTSGIINDLQSPMNHSSEYSASGFASGVTHHPQYFHGDYRNEYYGSQTYHHL